MALDLKSKTVLITGASSGIGRATASQFAERGSRLILAARRIDRLKDLEKELKQSFHVDVLSLSLDVQNQERVRAAVQTLSQEWRDIDVLVNNAGLGLGTRKLQEGNTEDWDVMIDTNVRGLLYLTREVLPGMVSRNAGHIINLGSVAGREYYPGGNVYCATKHAVKAICKCLRIDLLGTAVRVTEIAPGAVQTEFSEVRWKDKSRADEFYKGFTPLSAEDIADAIVYCASRPLHVDVAEMVIYPVAQASCNHLYREGSKASSMFD